MQRILNDPDNIVDEMLSGFLKANSDIVEATENKRVVKARCKGEGKVGVITGIHWLCWRKYVRCCSSW